MLEGEHLFNKHNPYQSIVQFTNHYLGLLDEQQKEFIQSLVSFFADNAYKDKVFDATERVESCFTADLEVLTDVLNQNEDQPKFEAEQFVATFAKVSNISTETLTDQLYQIWYLFTGVAKNPRLLG